MCFDTSMKSKADEPKPQNKSKENLKRYLGKKNSVYVFASFECL